MNMRKWLISAVTLTFALATAGAVTGFALTGDGGGDSPEVPNGGDTAGEVLHGDPTYEQWLSDHGDGKVVSIDDIDPNVCNAIHNINACTPEELEELGNLAAISWIVDSDTEEVEGEPEPLFEDGESHEEAYEVQSYEEAVRQDCGLAGGTVSVSSDGEVECHIVHDLEDGGEGETRAQPPVVPPDPEDLPAK